VNRALCVTEVPLPDVYHRLELMYFDLLYATTKLRYFVVYRTPNNDGAAEQYSTLLIYCESK